MSSRKPPWDKLYSTRRWRAIRQRHLDKHPLCVMCSALGVIQPANVCDHIEPHRGDMDKFWHGPFQSLCFTHHNSTKQSEEKGGKPRQAIGPDGWAIE